MAEVKPDESRQLRFIGTSYEIEALLRGHFEAQRLFAEKLDSIGDEELDAFDRSLYEVTLTPLNGVSKEKVRAQFLTQHERIRTERELYRLMSEDTQDNTDNTSED